MNNKFKVVVHIKTDNQYYIISEDIINATNAQDGEKMILYSPCSFTAPAPMYVREKTEFWNKFKLL